MPLYSYYLKYVLLIIIWLADSCSSDATFQKGSYYIPYHITLLAKHLSLFLFLTLFSNNLNSNRKLEGTQIFEMNEKKYKELIKKYNLRTLNGSNSKSNQYNSFSILFIGFLPRLRLTKLNCHLILNETFSIPVFKIMTHPLQLSIHLCCYFSL